MISSADCDGSHERGIGEGASTAPAGGCPTCQEPVLVRVVVRVDHYGTTRKGEQSTRWGVRRGLGGDAAAGIGEGVGSAELAASQVDQTALEDEKSTKLDSIFILCLA